ncbi:MAG: hypothetical protein FWF00_03835 [Endomicrobia bacterium]|nr:hypothetical protein [Endomicrobiia bacterium]MCL2506802.1 hypothetical protein [Endomicrobiia bacterium]
MLIWFVRILVILAGPLVAYFQVEPSFVSALIGLLISLIIVSFEFMFQKTPLDKLIIAIIGVVLGLVAARILNYGIVLFDNPDVSRFFEKYYLLINILFAYFGMIVAVKKKDEVDLLDKDIFKSKKNKFNEALLLDTSAIIDGRIYDIAETKFLLGALIIPKFVLNELHSLADSNDTIKRMRAKRGLDIVSKIKKSENIVTKIYDKDYSSIKGVDAKLIQLAKDLNAKIITTDFNLNKVASIQGITVLNINDLANSLTPIFLPGETIMIFLVKEGAQQNQAVGYLEDGTMVVAEDGRKHLGKRVELNVTSIIQTSSGRMVFGRVDMEHNPKKQNRNNGKES